MSGIPANVYKRLGFVEPMSGNAFPTQKTAAQQNPLLGTPPVPAPDFYRVPIPAAAANSPQNK